MRKKIYLLCIVGLMGTCLMGCQKQPASTEDTQKQQNVGTMEETEETTESQMAQNTEETSEPEVVEGDPYTLYVKKKNIYPMSESKTIDGIAQQVLKCEITRNFGERKLENLADYVRDCEIVEGDVDLEDIWNPNVLYRMDEQGNLTGSGCYVFCTIQFTNTTDKEVEFLRNTGKIYFLNEKLFVQEEGGYQVIYMDELWQGGELQYGEPSKEYHYKLGPGESVTSEVGWVVPNRGFEKYDHVYYAIMDAAMSPGGPATDPDAVFIELEK